MFICKLKKIIIDVIDTIISALELYFLLGYLCIYFIFKDYKFFK